MRQLLLTLAILLMLCTGCGNNSDYKEAVPDRMVYICSGPRSKAYHIYRDCKGLRKCSGEIELIELHEAEDYGRHPCHYCCE